MGYQICPEASSTFISNGPGSATLTVNFPLKLEGTRHEYAQVPPQPYSKLPWASVFPSSLRIWICGAGALIRPFMMLPVL